MDTNKFKGLDRRKKLVHAGSMHWLHWCVVVLSILLTVFAWYFSKEQLSAKVEAQFQREANQTIELVKERMELYENALWGGVALIDSNKGHIFYDQWLGYADSLHIDKTYPGINGIGVIFNVKPTEMDSYLAKERSLRPNYHLHPKHNNTDYWPITYIEPAATNKKAIGLDMAFETNRYTSILKARDTGQAQLTGPIVLVQDSKKTPGFLFYTPFYKNGHHPNTIEGRQNSIVGVTYAPFIMHKLMQGTLAKQKRQVLITISDDNELLYDDNSENEFDKDNAPLFSKSVEVEMYGRLWVFGIQSSLSFRQVSSNNQPLLILIGGIFIDALLLSLFIFLSRANRLALSYADNMLEELQDKTQRLEKSNQDLEKFSYLTSHDLKAPLNAINQLAAWIEADCETLIPFESKEHLKLLKQRSQRMTKSLDDLQEYTRINHYQYSNETCNIKAMIDDICFELSIPSGFSFTVPDTVINVPKLPFEMVLKNLISNAVKHHHKDYGDIIIKYDLSKDFYNISVIDDGPGIPEKLQAKSLEMFQTLKPRDQVEGSGMGLAIVKKIVEHYNGSMSINSKTEGGSCFIINWPRVR